MERLNGWKGYVLGIVALLISWGVVGGFSFSLGVSGDVAKALEHQEGQDRALENVRKRAIDNERDIRRVSAEWDQFKAWYKEDRKANAEAHKEILEALKEN